MKFDQFKELEMASYNECNVSVIVHSIVPAGAKCFKLHWHDRIEILRITKGEILLNVEANHFVAKENNILIFGPRQLHSGIAGENGAEYDGVMFELEMFKTPAVNKYFDMIWRDKIGFENISKKKEVLKTFDALYSLAKGENNANIAFETVSLIYRLFANLCNENEENQIKYYQRIDENFATILDYIDDHLTEPLTTEEISAKFGYSKSHFCRFFKARAGFSFLNYCRIARLERAKVLLKEKELTANEVAIKCGFRNYSYFSRTFKKYYSISPAEYVEKMRK